MVTVEIRQFLNAVYHKTKNSGWPESPWKLPAWNAARLRGCCSTRGSWTNIDLFLLILHELYHVILGHTRLFPRVAPIDNIVFDAVINSMLCRTVGRTVGTKLFTRLNGYDSLPERLLRPPPGWPDDFKGALAG